MPWQGGHVVSEIEAHEHQVEVPADDLTFSLTYPDEGLSRQELAKLVNAYVWKHHKTMTSVDANHIGKIERGGVRWPSKLCREAFRAILGVPTDTALGFTNPCRAVVKLGRVKRQQFVSTTTILGVGTLTLEPIATLLAGSEPAPIPRRIGATDIRQIRTATRALRSWNRSAGGGLAWEAARAPLRWSVGLLGAICPERLRPELYSAVADLAGEAGDMAVDADAPEEARWVWGFALGCAEEAEDWYLRAEVLASLAMQAVRSGRPDEGLTLVEHALVRADDRLTATTRAVLHTDRSRILATMRRVPETLRAIGTADDYFAHARPAEDPPSLARYNAAFHAGNTGKALADLAVLGRNPTEATERLTAAIAGQTASSARSRALCQAKLASLTMAPPATRYTPSPSGSRPWPPPAPCAPASLWRPSGNSTDTPLSTRTSATSPTSGARSAPWSSPRDCPPSPGYPRGTPGITLDGCVALAVPASGRQTERHPSPSSVGLTPAQVCGRRSPGWYQATPQGRHTSRRTR